MIKNAKFYIVIYLQRPSILTVFSGRDLINHTEYVFVLGPRQVPVWETKIFFRAGSVAYLEKLRSDRLRASSIKIQKIVRGWLARRRYAKIRKMVHLLQKHGRGMLARRFI